MRRSQIVEQRDAALAEVDRLTAELSVARVAGGLVTSVEAELTAYSESGAVDDEARRNLKDRVTEDERQRLVRDQEFQIEAEVREEVADNLRETEGPTIAKSIRKRFDQDGTTKRIEREARDAVERDQEEAVLEELRTEAADKVADPDERARIRDDLKASLAEDEEIVEYRRQLRFGAEDELRGEVVEELEEEARREIDSDESQAEVKAQLRESLLESRDIENFRDNLKFEQQRRLTGEVQAELEQDITAQVAADEPRVRAQVRRDLLSSQAIADFRRQQEAQQSRRVEAMTLEQIQAETTDEEFQRSLKARVERENEALRREETAAKLKEQFTRGDGIDMTAVEEGAIVDIYLGDSVGNYTFRNNNTLSTAFYIRKLSLSSLGDGKYVVNSDSLEGKPSLYERDNALLSGTRILVGRKEIDDGVVILEPALFINVPLCYDEDTTDTKITDARYGVLDVVVDKISARDVEHLDADKFKPNSN